MRKHACEVRSKPHNIQKVNSGALECEFVILKVQAVCKNGSSIYAEENNF